MSLDTFDFDNISEWGPRCSLALRDIASPALYSLIRTVRFDSFEEPFELIADQTDEFALIDAARGWIGSQNVAGYHGTRLNPAEIASVEANGLKTMVLEERMQRLAAILSQHPNWREVEGDFEPTARNLARPRIHQAHLTISRGMLMQGAPHYLMEGSEFDHAVTLTLLGSEACSVLIEGRSPTLFEFHVPGGWALSSGYGEHSHEEAPGLVKCVLRHWAYWLHDPAHAPGTQFVDFGLRSYEDIPPQWVKRAIPIDEAELLNFYGD